MKERVGMKQNVGGLHLTAQCLSVSDLLLSFYLSF